VHLFVSWTLKNNILTIHSTNFKSLISIFIFSLIIKAIQQCLFLLPIPVQSSWRKSNSGSAVGILRIVVNEKRGFTLLKKRWGLWRMKWEPFRFSFFVFRFCFSNLRDKDVTSKSDPMVVLFANTSRTSDDCIEIGRTEMIKYYLHKHPFFFWLLSVSFCSFCSFSIFSSYHCCYLDTFLEMNSTPVSSNRS
jgi:hypothetical protein